MITLSSLSLVTLYNQYVMSNLFQEPMDDLLDLRWPNLEVTRKALKHKIIKEINEGFDINMYRLDVRRLYIQAWVLYCSYFLMMEQLSRANYKRQEVESLEEIFWQDHRNLLFYGAPYSWLVINDDDKFENWTDLEPKLLQKQLRLLPETVNYGLVLKYYVPVSTVCNYIVGFNREEYHSYLCDRDFERTKQYALDYTHINMRNPNLTREDVEKQTADIDMVTIF